MRASTSSTRPWGRGRARSDHLKRLIFALLLLFQGGRAAAAEGDRPVALTLAGPVERLDRLEPSLSDLLGRLPIALSVARAAALQLEGVVEPEAGAKQAFVHIWVDLAVPERAILYFADSERERILIRRLPLPNALDEVEREEIAQVVRSAVEALLAGAKIGITRAEAKAELLPDAKPPPQPPKPSPTPVRRAPISPGAAWQAHPGAFYEAQMYRGSLWQGPGLLAGVQMGAVGGRATLQYRAPMQLDGDALGVRLQALSTRLLGTWTLALGGAALDFGCGPGLDVTYVEPRRVADRGVPGDTAWDLVPVARAFGAASFELEAVELGLFGGLDADLVQTRHVAERNGSTFTVFEAPRLRPVFGLTVIGAR